MLKDLSQYNHMSSFATARYQREAETGIWVFKTPSYDTWMSQDTSLLWLHGKRMSFHCSSSY